MNFVWWRGDTYDSTTVKAQETEKFHQNENFNPLDVCWTGDKFALPSVRSIC